jgi:hypothetical protein
MPYYPPAAALSVDGAVASDYVARIKETADTQYRAIIGVDASDRGQLLLGSGSAVGDALLRRVAAGELSFTTNGAAVSGVTTLASTAGQLGLLRLLQEGDTSDRVALVQYSGYAGIKLGLGGAAGQDTAIHHDAAAKILTVDDNAAGPIDLKLIGHLTVSAKRIATPSASQALLAATALLANAEYLMLTCTGAVTSTAAPTIADGTNGQMITVMNVGTGTWTISDQGTLASSNLRLMTTTIAIAPRQSIQMVYSATIADWVQIGALTTVI